MFGGRQLGESERRSCARARLMRTNRVRQGGQTVDNGDVGP